MIDFQKLHYDDDEGEMDLTCDMAGCEGSLSFDGTWGECIANAKAAGWRVFKKDDEWQHQCGLHYA